ncbi:MAG: hypothetical protein ACP5E3_06310 [Bacteroidales bacterium]
MSEDKVRVYSSDKVYKIDILKNLLSDHGIVSFSINKKDSLYHFGEIELYVDPDNVLRAKQLISKFES